MKTQILIDHTGAAIKLIPETESEQAAVGLIAEMPAMATTIQHSLRTYTMMGPYPGFESITIHATPKPKDPPVPLCIGLTAGGVMRPIMDYREASGWKFRDVLWLRDPTGKELAALNACTITPAEPFAPA